MPTAARQAKQKNSNETKNMYVIRFFLCVLLIGNAALSQAAESGDLKSWVPAGWKLISSVLGDLNKDGKDDAVAVMEEDNPVNRVVNEGLGAPELNFNPRRLMILLAVNAGYQQVLDAERFLPKENDSEMECLEDPFTDGDSIGIDHGILSIKLRYWSSCGTYSVSEKEFKFRYDSDRFRFIGLDGWSSSRSTGERSEFSANFLTGKKKTISGLNDLAASDEKLKPEIVWTSFNYDKRFYLDEMVSFCYFGEEMQAWCKLIE